MNRNLVLILFAVILLTIAIVVYIRTQRPYLVIVFVLMAVFLLLNTLNWNQN